MYYQRCSRERTRSAYALNFSTRALNKERDTPPSGGRVNSQQRTRSAHALHYSARALSRAIAAPLLGGQAKRWKCQKERCEMNALFQAQWKHCLAELKSSGRRTA